MSSTVSSVHRSSLKSAIAVAAVLGAFSLAVHALERQPCIGVSGPLTGPAAFGGEAIRMGAETAIDEINAKGGCLRGG